MNTQQKCQTPPHSVPGRGLGLHFPPPLCLLVFPGVRGWQSRHEAGRQASCVWPFLSASLVLIVGGTEVHHTDLELACPWNPSLTSLTAQIGSRVRSGDHPEGPCMRVRKEAGLEPGTSDSIEQRRQRVFPSPVQVLSSRKLLGVIDISGGFAPSSLFLLCRSAVPSWLPGPPPALTGTAETQLRPGLRHENSDSTAVPTQSQLLTWCSSPRCSCANSAVGRDEAVGPLSPGKEAQKSASSGVGGGGRLCRKTDRYRL